MTAWGASDRGKGGRAAERREDISAGERFATSLLVLFRVFVVVVVHVTSVTEWEPS